MRTIFTLAFFLSFLFSYAQNGEWEIFYPSLPAEAVAAQGNTILVGTNGGLTVFDTLGNRQFFNEVNSGIPNPGIRKTAIDAAGHWWVEYYSGFARFDGTDWQAWSKTDAGISNSETVSVLKAAPDGSVYAGTSAGFLQFKNDVWTLFTTANSGLPSNSIRDLTFDGAGNTYFATGAGLAITDGTNWTIHDAASTGLPNLNNVKSVAVTTAGIVWVTVGQNRFAKLESGIWTEYALADIGLPGSGFSGSFFYDEFDRLWLTFSNSIFVLAGGNWTQYHKTEIGCDLPGIPAGNLFLATDGAGQLWATTCDLVLFDGQTWEPQFTTNSILPSGVYAISEDADGNTWFGTDDGITKLDANGDWSNFVPEEVGASSGFNEISDILSDPNGDVWFGAFNELLRFDGNAWSLLDTCAITFPNTFVRASAVAPNGDRWFSLAPLQFFGSRLARNSASSEWTFFDPANSPLLDGSDVEAIAFEANGVGWFATSNHGLFQFDGAAWTNYTSANSDLPNDDVHDVAIAPDGAVWACTEQGLARFDGTTWTVFNTGNSGLPSDSTFRIAFDNLGGMYVGYDVPGAGAQVVELRNGVWTELAAPGYEDLGFDLEPPYAFTVDSQNRLWFSNAYYGLFSTSYPVFRYDPMLTGTEESNQSGFRAVVFPNPTNGTAVLQLPAGISGDVQIRVSNLLGQNVHSAGLFVDNNQPVSLDFGNFPAGIYWLTVRQGSRFSTVKVMRR